MLHKQLEYLYNLERYGIKLGLPVMKTLMAALGNPELTFKSVHITGTNGKGSTASLLESALRFSGVKTGRYTSPHLYRFNERIQVAGEAISDQQLAVYITQVRQVAAMCKVQPTFFEFTTAIAFLHFAQAGVELAVIEVGMGGLRDATNVIPAPLVAVITQIDLDHLDIIGPTKANIAQEKAGIIKPGTQVVTAEHDPEILQYIRGVSQANDATLYQIADCVQVQPVEATRHSQTFRAAVKVDGRASSGEYTIPLVGPHQLINAATVLVTLALLRKAGFSLAETNVAAGLAANSWEGRLEIVSEQPFILVDGAHNSGSLAVLHSFITDPATKMPSYDVLIVAMKQGKEQQILLEKIVPLFKQVIVTEGIYLPEPAVELAKKIQPYAPKVSVVPDAATATRQGLTLIGTRGAMLITGSLYMIPLALAHLKHKTPAHALHP